MSNPLDEINFEKQNGLIPAIAQDKDSKQVVMCAMMSREALEKTIQTGYAHYYSRTRKKIWKKGEESGHVQKVLEIRLDCDCDSVLLIVRQKKASCHEGYYSCFYKKLKNGEWKTFGKKIFDPQKVYGAKK